jgi:hypothetical protein
MISIERVHIAPPSSEIRVCLNGKAIYWVSEWEDALIFAQITGNKTLATGETE